MIRDILASALDLAVQQQWFTRMVLRDRIVGRMTMFFRNRAVNLSGTREYDALNSGKARRFENRCSPDQIRVERRPRVLLNRWANLAGKMGDCHRLMARNNAHQPRQVTRIPVLDDAIGGNVPDESGISPKVVDHRLPGGGKQSATNIRADDAESARHEYLLMPGHRYDPAEPALLAVLDFSFTA
jgi:hypothetical protein